LASGALSSRCIFLQTNKPYKYTNLCRKLAIANESPERSCVEEVEEIFNVQYMYYELFILCIVETVPASEHRFVIHRTTGICVVSPVVLPKWSSASVSLEF
jgi:hypothetical protein